jgi:pimeloyl-ACP methyl ester carboxylesterase
MNATQATNWPLTISYEPRFVFIHGAGGTRKVWRHQTSVFPDSLAVDLPGHPRGSGCDAIPEYAEFVTERIVEGKLAPAIPVGHSMGGAIAIEIALARPELLAGVVLVGSGARLRVTPVIKEEVARDYAHAAEVIAEWAYSPKTDRKLKNASIQELLEVPAAVTYGDFQACDRFDRMNEIGRIVLPTLIVCGEDDALTPVKYSQYLQDKIPNSRLVIVPEAGHSVMLEKPEALNAALKSFILDLRISSI